MGIFTDRFTLLKKADKPLYTAPQSVQQQIEILRIAKDGIFENTKIDTAEYTALQILIMLRFRKVINMSS